MKKTSCLGIYLATLFSCASGWTETNPPDVVKLDLIPGKIVEEDRYAYLDCRVVFFGKTSSLVIVPPAGGENNTTEFFEVFRLENQGSAKKGAFTADSCTVT